MHRCSLLAALSIACLGTLDARADGAPDVVASIVPVAGIAASIMDGVGEPVLLLEPGASPHAYSLRPSQAQLLASADLVLWVGPELERFLVGPIDALGKDGRQLALARAAGVQLLPFRQDALFEPNDAGQGHEDHAHTDHAQGDHAHEGHGHDDHDHGDIDGHVWLSPTNARRMAAAIADQLAAIDAANAALYARNLEQFNASLDGVEAEIEELLAPVRGRPFIVFHDAYRYFEEHFDIQAAGAVHVSPDVPPGAARVAEIQQRIAGLEAVCVFAEPQFEPRLVETLVEGSDARLGVLDPLGNAIAPGPDAYGDLLVQLARGLADCLDD